MSEWLKCIVSTFLLSVGDREGAGKGISETRT
jgi:hypothetical protein